MLSIPKRLKVGFQKRTDTYTGSLAYVIQIDNKGVIRKKHSWSQWRDKNIDPLELENVPTEGFVINKNVGGYSCGWNSRQSYIRVYDPRGFEFEITLPNLLLILQYCQISPGKGIEGEFVYSWDRADLVLLPVNSKEYKQDNPIQSSLAAKHVYKKDIILGHSYVDKHGYNLVYIGIYNYLYCYNILPKQYIFYDVDKNVFRTYKNLNKIFRSNINDIYPDYANLVTKYESSSYNSEPDYFIGVNEENSNKKYFVDTTYYYTYDFNYRSRYHAYTYKHMINGKYICMPINYESSHITEDDCYTNVYLVCKNGSRVEVF